jgi:hypothetical protein
VTSRAQAGFVAALTPERLDEIEELLIRLLGPDEARLLRPVLPEHCAAVLAELERLPWQLDPSAAADAAFELLVGVVDPADDEGDVVWAAAVAKLAENPRVGSKLARRWFGHLHRARGEDRPVSASVEGVAAYSVVAYEIILGRDHEVARWMQTAAIVTEGEDRPGLSLAVFVRGVRLLQALLRPWPSRSRP